MLHPLQFPGRPGPAGREGLPAHGAGHPQDQSQDHRYRGGPLLIQEPQLQVSKPTAAAKISSAANYI